MERSASPPGVNLRRLIILAERPNETVRAVEDASGGSLGIVGTEAGRVRFANGRAIE